MIDRLPCLLTDVVSVLKKMTIAAKLRGQSMNEFSVVAAHLRLFPFESYTHKMISSLPRNYHTKLNDPVSNTPRPYRRVVGKIGRHDRLFEAIYRKSGPSFVSGLEDYHASRVLMLC